LDHLPASRIDGVSNIGIQLGSPLLISNRSIVLQSQSARVAMGGPQVILAPAAGAMERQFAAWHRHKRSIGTFDNFQISDDETIIKCDGAKCPQSVVRIFHQLNANLGDLHGVLLTRHWAAMRRWESDRLSLKDGSDSNGSQSPCDSLSVTMIPTHDEMTRPAATHRVTNTSNLLQHIHHSNYRRGEFC
jgi:hypothetical protein